MHTASQEREREIIGEGNFKKRGIAPDTEVQFSGIVKEVQLVNPSITIVVEVRQATGAVQAYRLQGRSPKAFLSAGYGSLVMQGATVTVEGLSKGDDPQTITLATVTLPDGTKIFLGSSASGM